MMIQPPPLPRQALTDPQLRFLRLHQRHLVERTQAIFQGAMVRATTDRGRTATVRLDELETLLEAGVMAQVHGGAFVCTEQGRGL